MSLADILNLSRPGLVAVGVAASITVVGFTLYSLQYDPKVWDACEGVALIAGADAPFARVTERYLQQTRNWSQADYCIDKNVARGGEHIVSVRRSGRRVGGGEGFRLRIDPANMTVRGELAHE